MTKKIYIVGEISYESYLEFSKELDKLKTSKKYKRVLISLTSDGGDAFAALAYYDKIKSFEKNHLPIEIVGNGLIASAAVLILAAPSKRFMTPNAWVMLHEDEVILDEGVRVSQAEREIKTARRIEDQWCKLLAESTLDFTDLHWKKLHKKETWLNADECKRLNLIQGIIE